MTLRNLNRMFFETFQLSDLFDMDDLQVMWEALLERYQIKKPENWEEFIYKINSKSSDSQYRFSQIFDEYFIN